MLGTLSNPCWWDAANTRILLDTTWNGAATTYIAAPNDPNANGRAIYAQAVAGQYGAVAAYAAPVAAPPTVPQLRAYANAKADALRAVARTYALTGGLNVLSDATSATGTDLIGLMTWGQANPTATTNWVDDNGGVVTLTGAQCVALAQDVLAYGQSVFAVLA